MAKRNVWCSSDSGDLPRSFADLVQIYLDRTVTSLKFNALDAYAADTVWLAFTMRKRRNVNGYLHTL